MTMKFKAAVGSLLISAAVAGAAVMPASGQAAQPGDLCIIEPAGGGYGPVYKNASGLPGDPVLYWLYWGDYFRVVSYGAYDTYYGHGTGKPNGYVDRYEINQASCYQ